MGCLMPTLHHTFEFATSIDLEVTPNRRAQVATRLSIYKIIDRVADEQGRTRVHADAYATDKILWSWPLSQELRLELRMKSASSGTGFPGKLTRITGNGHELQTHQDSQVVDFP